MTALPMKAASALVLSALILTSVQGVSASDHDHEHDHDHTHNDHDHDHTTTTTTTTTTIAISIQAILMMSRLRIVRFLIGRAIGSPFILT